MQRLLDIDVSWLLPGHGCAHQFLPGQWKVALQQTLRHAAGATSTEQI